MAKRKQPSPYLNKTDFARVMGVSTTTVDQWLREKKVDPAFRTPTGRYRFRHPDPKMSTA